MMQLPVEHLTCGIFQIYQRVECVQEAGLWDTNIYMFN